MFVNIDPEVSYHVTIKLIRGVSLVVFLDNPLVTSSLEKTCGQLHKFLVSLNRRVTSDRAFISILLSDCQNAMNQILTPSLEDSEQRLHYLSSIYYILLSYHEILSQMLSTTNSSFPSIFEKITTHYLVAATCHLETAEKSSDLSLDLVKEVYSELLCEK